MRRQNKTYNKQGEKWCSIGGHYVHPLLFGVNNHSPDKRDWKCSECRKKNVLISNEDKEKKEALKRIDKINWIFGKSNSVVPKIEWPELLQTRLVNKANHNKIILL